MLLASPALAGDIDILNQGNEAYQKEQYAQAAQAYESLAEAGRANAAVYYNLGNAYYRLRQPGRAILNYERALALSPRDGDARFNLDFVNAQLNLPQPASALEQFAGWAASLFSLNELSAASTALWALTCALIILFLLRGRRVYAYAGAAVFAAFILSASWFGIAWSRGAGTPRAVVVAGPAEARNGPGADNSVAFTLPEGRKVLLMGGKDDWAAIGLAEEGLKGWVEKKYIERI